MTEDTLPPLRTLLKAFPGMSVDEARTLTRSGVVKSYPAGTMLCTEDRFESVFYIILIGGVQVTKKVNAAGSEVRHLKSLRSGDFFGEMALIQEAPRAATVTTDQPTSVLEIHKEDFDELLSVSPSLSRALMQEVINRLRANDAMAIEDLRIKAGELAVAYQRLAEQEYARSEFLTTIAHELRTPLSAASGFLHLVQLRMGRGAAFDGTELEQALQTATSNIEQIITLVNDILFVQEMDLILPHYEPVDLNAVITAVVAGSKSRRYENPVAVQVFVPSEPLMISGDMNSLQRAIGAILDNAIKFSHPGGLVEIRLERIDDKIRLRICDQGVGISDDILPHIFDRFFHVDRVGSRLFRGVGLGLSISRQVIEQHHGQIRVNSRLGEGTVVEVEFFSQG